METVPLVADDRVLVVAPHPDDETLGAGGLIQHALGAGATVGIVFLTDGENNPWAQRAVEMRWRIGPAERKRFSVRRRAEALAALKALGADEASAVFLHLPDQGLTTLLLRGMDEIDHHLRSILARFSPTVLVGPSLGDLHPDHSAAAVALDIASGPSPPFRRLVYTIHRPMHGAAVPTSYAMRLDAKARKRKRCAILAHRTQLRIRRPWFLSFVRAEEPFLRGGEPTNLSGHPIRPQVWSGSRARFTVATRPTLRAFGRRSVLLVAATPDDKVTSACAPLPHSGSGPVAVHDGHGQSLGEGYWSGCGWRGLLELPFDTSARQTRLYIKLEHRFGFFDEAGWLRVTPSAGAGDEIPGANTRPEARP